MVRTRVDEGVESYEENRNGTKPFCTEKYALPLGLKEASLYPLKKGGVRERHEGRSVQLVFRRALCRILPRKNIRRYLKFAGYII
jgi:hypothetical protein